MEATTRRCVLGLLGLGLTGLAIGRPGSGAESLLVEDWSASALGARGIPVGWRGQSWGHPAYDLTVEADGGERAVWDSTAPVETVVASEWTRTVTYVVLRSGPTDLGRWCDEERDVRDDYRRIYHEEPERPRGLSLGIDSNDTRSSAESFVGAIRFTAP
jgi:hypothetical protein